MGNMTKCCTTDTQNMILAVLQLCSYLPMQQTHIKYLLSTVTTHYLNTNYTITNRHWPMYCGSELCMHKHVLVMRRIHHDLLSDTMRWSHHDMLSETMRWSHHDMLSGLTTVVERF